MKEITIRQPDEWHAHLREKDLMLKVINLFNVYGRVVCMGNLTDPIDNLKKIISYRNKLVCLSNFLPIIGAMLTKNSTVEEWGKISDLLYGRVFIKYLPKGVTTNSDLGIDWPELKNFYPILELAQAKKIPFLIHAEIDKDPKTGKLIPKIDREKAAVPFVKELAQAFPNLIINVEHASTRAMIDLIKAHSNLSSSISPNHLIHRYKDVFDDQGKLINVHRYFKPVAKSKDDQDAVIEATLSGNPKFFFGSDSAPHLQTDKENSKKAGAFNALTNLVFLYEFFADYGQLNKFEAFVSEYGAKRYGLPLNQKVIRLQRQYWQVPPIYRGIVPDLAGKTMEWKIVE
jgi:dihydroorotase